MNKLCNKCKINIKESNINYCKSCSSILLNKLDIDKFKENCRSYTNVYIRRGYLIKEPCCICEDDTLIEAHHEDYNYPLIVVWLCKNHHQDVTNGSLSVKSIYKQKCKDMVDIDPYYFYRIYIKQKEI